MDTTISAGKKHWRLRPIVAIDTETTGLNADQGDRVVELAVVRFEDGVPVSHWGALLDPEMKLPPDTTRITGIRPEDVEGQPRFAQIVSTFLEKIAGCLLVAYNVPFDRGFLLHELARVGATLPAGSVWLDPLVFVKEMQRGQGSMRLGTVAQRMGIPLEEAHRATADAQCAGQVLQAIAGDLPDDLGEALDLQEQWEAKQNAERAGWRGKRRERRVAGATPMEYDGPRNSLGPGYPHGDELDPVRYMFLRRAGRG